MSYLRYGIDEHAAMSKLVENPNKLSYTKDLE